MNGFATIGPTLVPVALVGDLVKKVGELVGELVKRVGELVGELRTVLLVLTLTGQA